MLDVYLCTCLNEQLLTTAMHETTARMGEHSPRTPKRGRAAETLTRPCARPAGVAGVHSERHRVRGNVICVWLCDYVCTRWSRAGSAAGLQGNGSGKGNDIYIYIYIHMYIYIYIYIHIVCICIRICMCIPVLSESGPLGGGQAREGPRQRPGGVRREEPQPRHPRGSAALRPGLRLSSNL